MRTVYTAASVIDAQLVLDKLQASDIEAIMTGQQLVGAIGELPANLGPTIKILHDEDYLIARSIVEDFEDAMQENTESWTCEHCVEEQQGNFYQCWNCGEMKAGWEQEHIDTNFLPKPENSA